MLTIRIVWFHAVLILQDGEGDVLVRVAELLRQEISEDCSHGLRRRLIEAATESADDNGIVTLRQTNGEDGLDSLYKFLLFLSSERAALTLKTKRKITDEKNQNYNSTNIFLTFSSYFGFSKDDANRNATLRGAFNNWYPLLNSASRNTCTDGK